MATIPGQGTHWRIDMISSSCRDKPSRGWGLRRRHSNECTAVDAAYVRNYARCKVIGKMHQGRHSERIPKRSSEGCSRLEDITDATCVVQVGSSPLYQWKPGSMKLLVLSIRMMWYKICTPDSASLGRMPCQVSRASSGQPVTIESYMLRCHTPSRRELCRIDLLIWSSVADSLCIKARNQDYWHSSGVTQASICVQNRPNVG